MPTPISAAAPEGEGACASIRIVRMVKRRLRESRKRGPRISSRIEKISMKMLEKKNQMQKKAMVSHIDTAETTTPLGGIETRICIPKHGPSITQNYRVGVRLVEKDYKSLQAGGRDAAKHIPILEVPLTRGSAPPMKHSLVHYCQKSCRISCRISYTYYQKLFGNRRSSGFI